MAGKPSYEELEQKVKQLEKEVVERKRIENKLRKFEEMHRSISETTTDLIAITTFGLKPTYTFVSPSHKPVMGYDPEELLGKSSFQFIHPDDKKKLLPILKKYTSLKAKKLLTENDLDISEIIEYRARDKAGNWHYLQSNVNIIGDELLFISRDMTDRKQAKEELKYSEVRYRALIENVPIGIYYNDFHGRFLYGNKKAEEIIGYQKEELIGKSFLKLKLLGPKDLSKADKLLALNRLGKATGPDEFTLITKDASRVIVEINTEVITIEGNKVVLGMIHDITHRKQADDALLKRAEEFAALYETSLDITRSHDLSSLLETIVERAAQLLNCPSGGMYLCDPDRKEVRCVVSYKTSQDYTGAVLKYGEGAAGIIAQTKEPLIIDDYRIWPKRAAVYDKDQPFTAVISVPLIWQDEVIGVIHVLHDVETRHFAQSDLDLLTLFASQAATAVNNAQLVGEVQSHAAELENRMAELEKVNEQLEKEIKEHKRAEEKVRESEERYRAIFDQAADSIVIIDGKTGALAEFNEKAHKKLGFTREEFKKIKIPDFEVIEPDEEVAKHIKKIIREGADSFETKHRTKGSEIRDIHVSAKAISVLGKDFIQSIWHDITDRKRMEEALLESEKRYEMAASAGKVGIWDWNLETNEIYVDPNLKAILGYEDHEIRNHLDDWGQYVHPDDVEQVMVEANAHLKGLKPLYEVAHRMMHRDGSIRWFLARGTAIRDKKGKPFRVVGTDTDITKRVLVEEALRESEEKYKTLTENSLTGVFIHQDGRFVFVNDRFAGIHGYKPKELLGKEYLELVHPDEREGVALRVSKRLRGETHPWRYEVRRLKEDGNIIWCEMMATNIQYQEKPAIMGNIIDITDSKQAEKELKKSREQLRNLSAYLQSSREQERTSIAREIHDDLGQILTALKMDLSWLGKRFSKDQKPLIEKKKSMEKILEMAIKEVKRIITDLRPGVLDDLGLIAALEWQAQDFQDRTGIKCTFKMSPEEIVLDKEHSTAIFRISQETLTNAARHANATNVDIILKERTGYIALKISDNGKGITEKQISDSKSFGLMGIRERAHGFGGKVEIVGIPDKGTTVTVSIPIEKG